MRLIDADSLKRLVEEEWFDCTEKSSFFDEIDRTPTITAVPVVRTEKGAKMDDLISRRAAIKAIDDLPNCYNGYSDTYDKACIIGVLEEVPTIEPKPSHDWNGWENGCGRTYDFEPKRGKWMAIGNTGLAACECGYITDRYSIYNYCPNCGARMSDECAD